MLKIRKVCNHRDKLIAEPVFHLPGETRNHVVPLSNFLGQHLNITLLPETAFVADVTHSVDQRVLLLRRRVATRWCRLWARFRESNFSS